MKTLMLMAAGVLTVLGTAGCTDCGYYRFAGYGRNTDEDDSRSRRFRGRGRPYNRIYGGEV